MNIAELRKILQNALDNLNQYNDTDEIRVRQNTYNCPIPYISTRFGFIPLRSIEVDDDDDYFPESKKNKVDNIQMKNKKFLGESVEVSTDIIDDLIETAQENIDYGTETEEAIADAIDSKLIYSDDIIQLLKHYNSIPDSEIIDSYYDSLFSDIRKGVTEREETVECVKCGEEIPLDEATIYNEEDDTYICDSCLAKDNDDEVEESMDDNIKPVSLKTQLHNLLNDWIDDANVENIEGYENEHIIAMAKGEEKPNYTEIADGLLQTYSDMLSDNFHDSLLDFINDKNTPSMFSDMFKEAVDSAIAITATSLDPLE